MSLDSAIKFAKNATAEKVPFRFQFPVDTKEEFEELCEKHKVSMTDMILGLINSAIDEDKGLTNVSVVNIINKIEELETRLKGHIRAFKHTEESVIECTDGSLYYVEEEIEKTRFRIRVLNKELQRRTK